MKNEKNNHSRCFNAEIEAKNILYDHTAGFMGCGNYHPKSSADLWDIMLRECGFLLTEKLLDGVLTPMQYNEVRNRLAAMLNDVFMPAVEAERNFGGDF